MPVKKRIRSDSLLLMVDILLILRPLKPTIKGRNQWMRGKDTTFKLIPITGIQPTTNNTGSLGEQIANATDKRLDHGMSPLG